MLKMVDGTGIIGVDMICPLGVSTPQPPNYDRVELEDTGMLVLPNSLDAPLERLELGGKTEQVQTTGAQLITLANRTDVGDTELGGKKWLTKISEQAYSVWNNYQKATVEFLENNSFKLSHKGGSLANGNGLELPVKIKPDTDYTLSYASSVSVVLIYAIQMDSGCNKLRETSSRDRQYTFHSEANAEWVILKFTSIANNSYVVNNIQFEEGTVATPYEPYTGGKPSPSPEYPQEIKSVGKWNESTQKYEIEVVLSGKNLLDITACEDGKTLDANGNIVNNANALLSDFIPCFSKTSYCRVEGHFTAVSFYDVEKNKIGFINQYDPCFATPDKCRYFRFSLNKTKADYEKAVANVGTALMDYEPYKKPQTLTLTSDRPLTKWDKLVEQGGQIGWLYQSKIVSLTGKEKWSSSLNAFYTTAYNFTKNNVAKCSHYAFTGITNQEKNNIFSIGDGSYTNSLWVRDTRFSTAQDFKAHLSELAEKGTPLWLCHLWHQQNSSHSQKKSRSLSEH